MQTKVELPQAFSVRDENEFLPIRHLLARLNPKLRVERVATGVHEDGGTTVFWGIVYRQGQALSKSCVESALRKAGFDFGHNVLVQASDLGTAPRRACA